MNFKDFLLNEGKIKFISVDENELKNMSDSELNVLKMKIFGQCLKLLASSPIQKKQKAEREKVQAEIDRRKTS